MKNNTIITIIILFTGIELTHAQVGGLSASKLATLCVETVPNKSIEFEPAIGYTFMDKKWNNSGQIEPVFPYNDSSIIESYMGFRLTYGVFNNFEAGIAFPFDMSILQIGIKYKLPINYKNFQFGLFAGTNFLTGNKIILKKGNAINITGGFVSGVILSYQLNEKVSIDFNTQYQHLTQNIVKNHNHDILLNCDFGYFINKSVQFVFGTNYIKSDYSINDYDMYRFTLNPGLTIERAKDFILVLNFPFDIFGENTNKSNGASLALTIMIN